MHKQNFLTKSLLTYFPTAPCTESEDINSLAVTRRSPDAMAFWQEHRATYSCLADTALDFVAVPASQAYVERVFWFVACSLKGAATECLSHWKCGCG